MSIGDLTGVLMMAVIVEAIVNVMKCVIKDKQLDWLMLVSMAVGIGVAIAYNVDLLKTLGMETQYSIVGSILTGILLSRGSNYVADLTRLLSLNLTKSKMMIQAVTEVEQEHQQYQEEPIERKPIREHKSLIK